MRRCLARFVNLFRSRNAEREMTREIESHLALIQEDFERAGMSPREAALAARRAYGGVEQSKEMHRDARTFVWIEQLLKDVRYAWRNLLRNPGFTVAVGALALGIGANATIFGVYNAVALKPLPVANAGRVVRLKRWFQRKRGDTPYGFSNLEYQYVRDHNDVFASLVAAYGGVDEDGGISALASIGGAAEKEHLDGRAVSANYFAGLGISAYLGRTFLPEEDRTPGGSPAIVLTYRFWQRRLQGDRAAIGRTISLNGLPYAIIGVAPPKFTGSDLFPTEFDFWAPLSMIGQLDPPGGANRAAPGPGPREFQLLARLKGGVSRAQAQSEADLPIRQFLSAYREQDRTASVTLETTAYFGNTDDAPVIRQFTSALLAVVSLVLLVACANVANMLLARGAARQHEIGVRMAVGASRGRVVRQLLAESVLLAWIGGAAGVVVSAWSARLLWIASSGVMRGFHINLAEIDFNPDIRLFVYGLLLSTAAGVLFGLAPALRSTRMDLTSTIKGEGSMFGRRLGRSRLRGLLLGAQVTVSTLLLLVSGDFAAAVRETNSDPGFATRDTYLFMADGGDGKAMRERLAKLPEIAATAIGDMPLMGNSFSSQMAAGKVSQETLASHESDGYFETLRIRMVRGRTFTREEAAKMAPVAVISEATAKLFWPGADPLGKHFTLDRTRWNKIADFEVIGISADIRHWNLTEVDPSHVYLPTDGSKGSYQGGLVFRIRGNRGKALAAVQAAVESMDRSLLPGLMLVSLEDGPVAMQRQIFRISAGLAAALTLLSLALAAVGIYGVMAFLVSRRTREIGIRMALGATPQVVMRKMVAQGLRPVLIGMAIGFALAVVGDRIFSSPEGLSDSTLLDPKAYALLALVFAIAVLASVIPAKRALRLDPIAALRHE